MRNIRLIVHDIRSIHNVGSLLRTADGLHIEHVYLTGFTPHPETRNDERLPHEIKRTTNQLHKTALGAEINANISYQEDVAAVITDCKKAGYIVVALEQDSRSIALDKYKPTKENIALLIGREVEGIETDLLNMADDIIEIPMHGTKESLNVVQATAIAIYQLHII